MATGENGDHRITDLDLIKGCQKGEVAFQEMLYRRFFSFGMSICIRYSASSEEAMEVVNDSFVKAFDRINDYDVSKPFGPWFAKILVHTAIDSYRKNSKHRAAIPLETMNDTEDVDPEIDAKLSAGEILTLFAALPETYRVTFNLYEIEGYSHEEIANILGINASTSRSNLTRAKKMLRILYTKHFYSERKHHEPSVR